MDKKYSIKEVFNMLGEENLSGNYVTKKNRQSIIIDGYKVYTKSLRYMTFFQKGTICTCCGREGAYFKLDVSDPKNPNCKHFNLYCEDGMLMTKDHIIPKSLGGTDTVTNLQPMCRECNVKKGNGKEQQFTIMSVDSGGNIKKYTSLANATLSFIQNRKNKKPQHFVEEVIEKSEMIKDAIINKTTYRNRKWYMVEEEL